MKTIPIESGVIVMDCDKVLGVAYLARVGKELQLHGDNYCGSPIKSVRFVRSFLKDKGLIFSGCSKTSKVCRFLEIVGFKKIGEKDNANVYAFGV